MSRNSWTREERCHKSHRVVQGTCHTTQTRPHCGDSRVSPILRENSVLSTSRCLDSARCPTRWARSRVRTDFQSPFLCIWNE